MIVKDDDANNPIDTPVASASRSGRPLSRADSSIVMALSSISTGRPEFVAPQQAVPVEPAKPAILTPSVPTLITISDSHHLVDVTARASEESALPESSTFTLTDARTRLHRAARVHSSPENDLAGHVDAIVASRRIISMRYATTSMETTPPQEGRWDRYLEQEDL